MLGIRVLSKTDKWQLRTTLRQVTYFALVSLSSPVRRLVSAAAAQAGAPSVVVE